MGKMEMDPGTIFLIASQSVTFCWLVVTEVMPFLNVMPYNGLVHMVVGVLSGLVPPKPDVAN
jgi:hypothetical protein